MTATAPSPAAAARPTQYLTFTLDRELYAIGILAVREIIEFNGLTTVPTMPGAISGVINLRGAVVPVMDLATRFGRPSAPVTKRTCVVIVETGNGAGQQVVGVIVDAVNAVLDILPEEREQAPSFGLRGSAQFVESMGKVNGKFVIILDLAQVMAFDGLDQVLVPESA